MPTISIETRELRPTVRMAISVRLTRWLADRNVDPAHVVVRFATTADRTVFSGGVPVEALGHGSRTATAICCVAPDRDDAFRGALAEEIAAALGMSEDASFLYVEFRPTPPGNVYVAHDGRLSRADTLATDNGTR